MGIRYYISLITNSNFWVHPTFQGAFGKHKAVLEGRSGESLRRSDRFRGVVYNHCLPLHYPHKSKISYSILSFQSFVRPQIDLKPSRLQWLPPDSSTTSHRRHTVMQTLQQFFLASSHFPLFSFLSLFFHWFLLRFQILVHFLLSSSTDKGHT